MKNLKHHIILSFLIGLFCLAKPIFGQDTDAPDTPVIDSVSVRWQNPTNPNGDILISWQLCDSTDIRSYYILYLDNILGTYQLMDSVDANTHTYLDTSSVTNPSKPQTYVVQAVDSANNTSVHSNFHRTGCIQLSKEVKNCQTKVKFTWNRYQGERWNDAVQVICIYLSENGNTTQITHLLSPQEDSFSYFIPDNHRNYDFFIRFYNPWGQGSTSNKITFMPLVDDKPSYFKPNYCELSDSKISLEFLVDKTAQINNYELARSPKFNGYYKPINNYNHFSDSIIRYTDNPSKKLKYPFFYKLFLIDDCGNKVDSSEAISTILLKGKTSENINTLNWTIVENGNSNRKYFDLLAHQNNESNLLEIITETPVNLHKHQLLSNMETQSGLCYYINYHDDIIGYNSRSNTICLWPEPKYFFPTAFSPFGREKNRVFKPVLSFIKSNDYLLSIYDRNGLKVFETTDFKKAWDGKHQQNKQICPNGTYTYFVRFYSAEGNKYEKIGIFKLIF